MLPAPRAALETRQHSRAWRFISFSLVIVESIVPAPPDRGAGAPHAGLRNEKPSGGQKRVSLVVAASAAEGRLSVGR